MKNLDLNNYILKKFKYYGIIVLLWKWVVKMKKLEKMLFAFVLFVFSCSNVFAQEFKMLYDSTCVVERTYTIYQMFYVEDGAYKVSSDWKEFYTNGAGKSRVAFDENDVLINVEGSVYADDFVKDAVEYAKGLEDMKLLNDIGQGRIDVTVGSALDLFGGNMSFDEAVRFCK